LWALILAAAAPAAGDVPPSSFDQRFSVNVEQQPLEALLAEIERQCDVAVTGLEERFQEPVTFAADGEPVEAAVKRLLRSLDETNYAFFYSLTRLRQVSVLPRAKGPSRPSIEMPAAQAPPEPGLSPPVARDAVEQAVRVINVNAGTQAERLDLRRGDLVVEYDGVQIRNSQQLVSIVRQKSDAETVEMVVVRDGEPLRMSLNGGLIGINVKTVAVPSAAMGEP
jgi:hypothetical protein